MMHNLDRLEEIYDRIWLQDEQVARRSPGRMAVRADFIDQGVPLASVWAENARALDKALGQGRDRVEVIPMVGEATVAYTLIRVDKVPRRIAGILTFGCREIISRDPLGDSAESHDKAVEALGGKVVKQESISG